MKQFVVVILLVTFLALLRQLTEELSPVAATHYMKACVALIDNDFNKALEEINTAGSNWRPNTICPTSSVASSSWPARNTTAPKWNLPR